MAVDKNLIKLAAVAVVGGVAKSLFAEPRPITNNYCPEPKPDNVENINKEINR